ncbi:amino acid ABC transporter substrate-binding protein [Pleurocapsales cyanobacterium LEGE 10410]|nr:amino acid ABC transporter substrate-binding protein [Pleurocapsales cyanobacterium LEGE 10410]
MNRLFVSCLVGSLFLFSTSSAKAEGVLDRIQRTGVLNLAIREDAPPFGYLDANDDLQGYCLDFFALLKKQLIARLERNTLSLKLLKSTPSNRFDLVARNIVSLECGPNTIRSDIPENTDFSTGFFVTGTQFFVRKNNSLNLDGDLANTRLGVINNTTTAQFIAQRYPSARLRRYRGITARNRGIQAVEQGQIDAMISDGILLKAAAQRQGLSLGNYSLIPDVPLTCDRYGMVVAGGDRQWLDFVNSVINSSEAAALSTVWFGRLFSYAQAEDFCE